CNWAFKSSAKRNSWKSSASEGFHRQTGTSAAGWEVCVMDVREAIERRRAYRSLSPVEITPELLADLAHAASLAPSCFNKQPWRFVAVYDREILSRLHGALARGNEWARDASMLIAVCSRKDLDCVLGQREYFL